jgi:trimethylamine---corrinoid protein Co-methyltransferase
MLNRAIANFDQKILDQIHHFSIEILDETGIRFPSAQALEVFKKHGFRVDGETVFFTEKQIEQALTTVPTQFQVHSRNENRNIFIGDDGYVLAPGYGPPFIIKADGSMRQAVLDDVSKFCKLVQMADCLDFNSSIVVQPNDVPQETAHLDILLETICMTDKPLMGSSSSGKAAKESLALAKILWGKIDKPVMISLVDSLSPLQYASEMADALVVYAKAGQPLIIHSSCSMGTTGPITLAGSLVVSNAATLAGICLSQIINPGTPVIYGLGGSPTDMKTGGYINASPEDVKHTAIVTALGRYYKIPCRSQGALTESFSLDYQAGMESTMMLTSGALSGSNVCLHATGTYGSMLAMSYEKFMADVDLCGAIKKLLQPVEFSEDTFAIELIKEMGAKGNYLMQSHTHKRCRTEFYIPDLNIRTNHTKWMDMDQREMIDRAGKLVKQQLDQYQKPDIDPSIEKDLVTFITRQKTET